MLLMLGYPVMGGVRQARRNASVRWPPEALTRLRQREASAPPTTLSAEEQEGRERAHAYWEAAQPPEDTLPAEGFIGDDADAPSDGGRDPDARGH